MKKTLLALALALTPAVALADKPAPPPFLVVNPSNPTCQQINDGFSATTTNPDITSPYMYNWAAKPFFATGNNFASCAGFWDGNTTPSSSPADFQAAMTSFGYVAPNFPTSIGTTTSINGATGQVTGLIPLAGETIIGIHWGGGNSNLQSLFGNGNGYGTVFFKFTNIGTSTITLNQSWIGGFSNVFVYKTTRCVEGSTLPECGGGGQCTTPGGCVVPEPNSYILVASGLAGLGFLARRRRRNV